MTHAEYEIYLAQCAASALPDTPDRQQRYENEVLRYTRRLEDAPVQPRVLKTLGRLLKTTAQQQQEIDNLRTRLRAVEEKQFNAPQAKPTYEPTVYISEEDRNQGSITLGEVGYRILRAGEKVLPGDEFWCHIAWERVNAAANEVAGSEEEKDITYRRRVSPEIKYRLLAEGELLQNGDDWRRPDKEWKCVSPEYFGKTKCFAYGVQSEVRRRTSDAAR